MSEHDLRDLERAGCDIEIQHILVGGKLGARVAVQYNKALITSDIVDAAIELAAMHIAEETAKFLTEMEGKES